VNCPAVRDRLPEHSLGVVDHRDATSIERHLAWCAACRKEARDLERAAATMAFALAPAHVGPELEERIVGAVGRVAGPSRGAKPGRRRGRRAGVILLAAAFTVAGIGAGSVLGRHDGPLPDPTTQAHQQEAALDRFRAAIESATVTDPGIQPQIGTLAAPEGAKGAGAALALVSPSADDQVVVWVNGLAQRRIPYRVFLSDGRGHAVPITRITKLDKDGGAMVARVVGRDLSRFVRMIVRNANGKIVLAGALSPAPPAG
jgi:hypothetical protein